jgi:hypothetical protein
MLQSWNKFCFTGGILEIDLQFPGEHDVGGLWPAVWLLGNLARATFLSSTNLMWPWSYAECNRDLQKAQEVCMIRNICTWNIVYIFRYINTYMHVKFRSQDAI